MGEILTRYVSTEELAFGLVCGVIALVLILLDWLLLMLKDQSVTGIAYGNHNRYLILVGWALASAFVGIVSGALKIVQENLQGAFAVAIGWPIILARIVDMNGGTPIQSTSDEEEEEED